MFLSNFKGGAFDFIFASVESLHLNLDSCCCLSEKSSLIFIQHRQLFRGQSSDSDKSFELSRLSSIELSTVPQFHVFNRVKVPKSTDVLDLFLISAHTANDLSAGESCSVSLGNVGSQIPRLKLKGKPCLQVVNHLDKGSRGKSGESSKLRSTFLINLVSKVRNYIVMHVAVDLSHLVLILQMELNENVLIPLVEI